MAHELPRPVQLQKATFGSTARMVNNVPDTAETNGKIAA